MGSDKYLGFESWLRDQLPVIGPRAEKVGAKVRSVFNGSLQDMKEKYSELIRERIDLIRRGFNQGWLEMYVTGQYVPDKNYYAIDGRDVACGGSNSAIYAENAPLSAWRYQKKIKDAMKEATRLKLSDLEAILN